MQGTARECAAGSRAVQVTARLRPPNCGIVSALAAIVFPGWVMSQNGLALFGLWNLIVAAMTVLALLEMKARQGGGHLFWTVAT
jgi:hypothetical protein